MTIVTGDSVLTACHVATEVGLIDNASAVAVPTGTTKGSSGGKAVDNKGLRRKAAKSSGKAKRKGNSGDNQAKEIKSATAKGGRGKGMDDKTSAGKTALLLTVIPTEKGVSHMFKIRSVRRAIACCEIARGAVVVNCFVA